MIHTTTTKKMEKLLEVNATLKLILMELETRIFIENINNPRSSENPNKKVVVESK